MAKSKNQTGEKSKIIPIANLPQGLEAERRVLGELIDMPSLYYGACLDLTIDDFVMDAHRRIFRGLLALFQDNLPVDVLTVSQQLQATKELEAAGGMAYLSDLSGGGIATDRKS